MLPKSVTIKNFRSLADVKVNLSETTVIIGENNTGKSALLDALKLSLSHRWGTTGTGFKEFDLHLSSKDADPKRCPAAEIEVEFAENEAGEWHDEVIQEIQNTIILDPKTGANSIRMRTEYAYDPTDEKFVATWVFLNAEGEVSGSQQGRASNANVSRLVKYVPVFSLAAIRDAGGEFGGSSQFWRRLIQSIQIEDEDWEELSKELTRLNDEILAKDPKFSSIKTQLEELKAIFPPNSVEAVDLRALPLRIFDLIAKTEMLIRASDQDPWLPLESFGQGVQSISVLNVFRAYVTHLLSDTFRPESQPVLLMEEPEAHLHPHAVRALSRQVQEIPGMKVVTTHSASFVQHVPFQDIRLFRKDGNKTVVFQLESESRVSVPISESLRTVVGKHQKLLSIDEQRAELVATGALPQPIYREVLTVFSSQEHRDKYHPLLVQWRQDAKRIIAPDVLQKLEDQAKRIRGDIFFARKWFFVEGQADVIVANAVAASMGINFDQMGISVIDVKNNGSAGGFAGLARSFGFPWAMFVDADQGGESARSNIENQDFESDFLDACVFEHEAERDLESTISKALKEGNRRSLLKLIGNNDANPANAEQVAEALREVKMASAFAYRDLIATNPLPREQLPQEIIKAIEYLLQTERCE